jgi:hypothetical protein
VQPHECTEKDNIKKLFDMHEQKLKDLAEIKIRQAEIQGTVNHISGRIDNGMSHTIHNLDQTLTKLEPVLNHHSEVIRRIEGMGWTLATTLLISLLGFLAGGLANGFKVKL